MDGHITADPGDTFTVVTRGLAEPLAVAASQRGELRALLELRDGARALLAAEASTLEDTEDIADLRVSLRGRYLDYHARYGPINRFSLRRTRRIDPGSGEERLARLTPPALRLLHSDPFAALVHALENFDETAQAASPAGILTERVVVPRAPRLGADSPQDALAICLDTHGRVELDEIARLLGVERREARAQLGELVYDDPVDDRLVPAAEYLSGNVRVKLDEAMHARPGLKVNARALQRALPVELTAEEIEPRLGAVWIDTDTHRQFLAEVLEDDSVEVEHPGGSIWAVKGRGWTVKASSEWGTSRMPAPALAKAAMEQRPIQVTDELVDGRRVVNPTETAAAQEKAQALQERFAEWCWEDPERVRRLAPSTTAGSTRSSCATTPSRASGSPCPAWRVLHPARAPARSCRADPLRAGRRPASPSGGGQDSGDGLRPMEMRRLGLVTKPGFVVPNHMLEQFSGELLQLYPRARVLMAQATSGPASKPRVRPQGRGERLGCGDHDPVHIPAPTGHSGGRARLPGRQCSRCAELEAAKGSED